MDDRYLKSSFYEQLVEHVFVSEVLQEAWYRHGQVVEVLRSEVDAYGYDVVLECGGIVRHVQLKASHATSRTARQNVNVALAAKASGCIVWLIRDEDEATARMTLRYRFFGGEPGRPLPDLEGYSVGRHTKADSTGLKKERPAIRVVPKGAFEELDDTSALVRALFGFGSSVESSPGSTSSRRSNRL